jgi:hypothetical protein
MKTAGVANGVKGMACWIFKQPGIRSTVCPTLNFLISYNFCKTKNNVGLFNTPVEKFNTSIFILNVTGPCTDGVHSRNGLL